MRLVEGEDLGEALDRDGAMSSERAVSIIGQIARALDAAHDDGLIHRDVKPSNVLISDPGSDEDFIYLVDFGIARTVGSGAAAALTHTGAALGSFDYMAPERFLDTAVDRRTDVYSLACLLYECLIGSRPFNGDGLPTLMYAHLNLAPPRPSAKRSGIPYALDEVIATGMAKSPDQRFARAGDLGAAARAALAGPRSHSFPAGGHGSAAGWAAPIITTQCLPVLTQLARTTRTLRLLRPPSRLGPRWSTFLPGTFRHARLGASVTSWASGRPGAGKSLASGSSWLATSHRTRPEIGAWSSARAAVPAQPLAGCCRRRGAGHGHGRHFGRGAQHQRRSVFVG